MIWAASVLIGIVKAVTSFIGGFRVSLSLSLCLSFEDLVLGWTGGIIIRFFRVALGKVHHGSFRLPSVAAIELPVTVVPVVIVIARLSSVVRSCLDAGKTDDHDHDSDGENLL